MGIDVRSKVVVGMNAGDEGKGLVTDYLANQAIQKGYKTLVVLNNGGPQRSHTVSLVEGIKHAFRHFGSGTFIGADTYLSEFFIINPMVFVQEYKELNKMGFYSHVYIDKKCRITTPYEMYLNQMLEESRGEKRHGSCGMGIWQTVKLYNDFSVCTWGDIKSFCDWIKIRKNYFDYNFKRYKENQEISNQVILNWSKILYTENDAIIEKYLQDCYFMLNHTMWCDAEIIKKYDEVIFENGQGLLLNDDPDNVHTTPSNTGLDNVRVLEQKLGFYTEPYYVTRTYLTRHGIDPNFKEDKQLSIGLYDETNIPNEFQGTIRYGQMDYNFLERLRKDSFDREFKVVITHKNEIAVPDYMYDNLNSIQTLYSTGKERESIK